LGSGTCANVHRAIFNGQEVAVKKFNKKSNEKADAEFLKEV
jgi:ABC-type branched-subunit amino acid transport system substrate-binding protein